jgi:hypothetical protein
MKQGSLFCFVLFCFGGHAQISQNHYASCRTLDVFGKLLMNSGLHPLGLRLFEAID